MIRRVGAWLRRGLAVATDQRAEDEALVRAWTVAVVAQAVRCTEHPDRPAVVRLQLADGTLVGQCTVCCVGALDSSASVAGAGVAA